MKVATCVILCAALACLMHETLAQQNWWERLADGSTTIAAGRSRTTTTAPTSSSPAASTNCPCPTTPEYNPVCGNDRVTYTNLQLLECAKSCGQPVELLFYGRCEKLA